jgi:hypothetical protein
MKKMILLSLTLLSIPAYAEIDYNLKNCKDVSADSGFREDKIIRCENNEVICYIKPMSVSCIKK